MIAIEESSIYLHVAVDGKPHCSYDLDFDEVDRLEPPKNTMMSTLEYVENRVYQEDDVDELLESVPTEEIRAVGAGPPQVGTMYYQDGVVEEIEIDLPDSFSEW